MGERILTPPEAAAYQREAGPDLYGALTHLVKVIEAAGLLNLSNGVQLGPTVWYVKACDAIDYARRAIAKAEAREP